MHYLGVVASKLGHLKRAARLFGAAEALRDAARRSLSPADRAEHQRHVETVRRALGENGFSSAWADGQAMSFERAVEYALTAPPVPQGPTPRQDSAPDAAAPTTSVARAVAPTSASPPATNCLADSPLTARELEVALLLARGMSNRQVADALVIAERTASTHVSHILTKLGFSTRAQVAAWTVEHGLAAR